MRVPLFPFGHAFRAGSRVRIVVQPPGGNRPSWAFDALAYPTRVTDRIALGGEHASKVVLPVVSGRRRADAAARVWQPAGPTVPPRTSSRRPNTERARDDAPSLPCTSSPTHYVERFAALDPLAATGEGIAGHDHEMTDFSPDGIDERAEHDRATLRALDAADDRRPTPTASPPR